VAGVLVLLSIVLITIYFRESAGGGLHSVQSAGATVLRPFEVAANRIARPFRDGYGYFAGLVHAKSQNADLRAQLDKARQQLIQNLNALEENDRLRKLLNYEGASRFPQGFDPVTTDVIGQPPSEFEQRIGIAAGSSSGIRRNDPVVTQDGLVGLVTQVAHNQAQVTLLSDQSVSVAAYDLNTSAAGVVTHGQGRDTLNLDQVAKADTINRGDLVVTAGWKLRQLSSIYPKGIQIGVVTRSGQSDTDLFKQVQIQPFVDFSSLQSVVVLIPKNRSRR
jgi:rod shape-determining protein MreC